MIDIRILHRFSLRSFIIHRLLKRFIEYLSGSFFFLWVTNELNLISAHSSLRIYD